MVEGAKPGSEKNFGSLSNSGMVVRRACEAPKTGRLRT
jgi:hypothetical protein